MRHVFQTLVILLSLIAFACNNPAATANATASIDTAGGYDDSEMKAFIEKSNAAFGDEVTRGDSGALAAHYSSDAMVMPSNSEAVKAPDIAGFWGGAIRMFGVKDLKLTVTDVMGNVNIAVETGTYEMLGEGNKSLDKGKYVVVWKKEDGNWKMYRDIFNTNMPAVSTK